MANYRQVFVPGGAKFNWFEDIEKSAANTNLVGSKHLVGGVTLGIQPSPFACCGLIGISYISYPKLTTWKDKADMVNALVVNFATPGHLMYVLERHQLNTSMHLLLVELGAKQMGDEFRNLNYSDHYLSIWLVNITDRSKIEKYLDQYNRPRPEPTNKVAKEAVTKTTTKATKA